MRNKETACSKCIESMGEEKRRETHNSFKAAETEGGCSTDLYILVFSTILYAVGLLLKFILKIEGVLTLGIFTTAYLLVGLKVIKLAIKGFLTRNFFNENLLLTIATLGAYAIMEYPEATGVMLFYRVGEYLQDLAINRSRRSIRSLLKLKSEYANLKLDGKMLKVKPEDVNVGDLLIVRPGEKIPLDGIVVEGASTIDTSALTGESIPKIVKPGDEVLSGTINLNSLLVIKATKEYSQSTVARILDLVEKASSRKAKTERFITRFARYYTPAVVSLAILIATLPPIITGDPLAVWVYKALVLLVISCPCALVLSIPLGYFSGLGKSAKNGILVKGSNFLDLVASLKTVVFDKTGTLTKGVFKVSRIVPKNGFSEEELLRYAALAEAYSSHPIAQAIRAASPHKIEEGLIRGYEEIPGYGVRAKADGVFIIVGNDKLLHRENIEHDLCDVAEGTVAHVVINNKYAGYIVISDELKEEAYETIKELRKLGVSKILMFTGDSRHVAKSVAEKLKLDGYYAELLPKDKVRLVEELCNASGKKGTVAFVGDGVNDAPVIARADVGIAMGALGSDAAIEIADLVIMDDKLTKVPLAIRTARKTKGIVMQNIVLALLIKLFFISLGVLGRATMWEALFADVGVTLITVLNSARILR